MLKWILLFLNVYVGSHVFSSIFAVHFLSLVSVSEPEAFDPNIFFGREMKGYPTYQLANTQVSNRLASYLTSKLTNTVADKLAGKFSEVRSMTLPTEQT